MISTCLEMAVRDGVKSIGFPTVGCGRLGYNHKDVVDSFIRSQRISGSSLQVKSVDVKTLICK